MWVWWVLGIVAGIAGVGLVAVFIGSTLPTGHEARRAIRLMQSPDVIWQTITDIGNLGSWNEQVLEVERLADLNGHEVWRETYKGNLVITLETTESARPTRLVRQITDVNGPFTGRWEYALAPADGGCRVSVTEFGEIANPIVRLMARMFMDPAMYLELYLKALAKKFGEEAVFEA